jgi:hypothetical protein
MSVKTGRQDGGRRRQDRRVRRDNDGGNAGYQSRCPPAKSGEYMMRFDRSGLLTRKWFEAASDMVRRPCTYDAAPQGPFATRWWTTSAGSSQRRSSLREIKPTYEVHALIGKNWYDIRLDTAAS